MSDHDRNNPDDLLETSLMAMRNEQIPPGPSPAAIADTLAALRRAEKPSNFFHKVVAMVQAHKLAASIALTLSGAAIWLVVILAGSFASVSFAQVAEKLQSIRFLTCTISVQVPNQGKSVSIREMFMSPGKMRTELLDGMTTIADVEAGRSLLLEAKTKTATVFEINAQAAKIQPSLQNLDIIGSFRNLAKDKSKPLDDRQIGDIKAKGFRVQKGDFNEDIYVDPKTGLPIQVDLDMGQTMGLGPIVINDFNFNANLDPALFSVDPPAGYKIKAAPKIDVNVDLGQNVVPVLRAYASSKDGQFPPSLENAPDLMATIMRNQTGKRDPVDTKLFNNISMTAVLLLQLHKGKGWDYFPDGARLGDSDTIVLWYQTADKKGYKAIYGDLHIADIAADQLPKPQDQSGGI